MMPIYLKSSMGTCAGWEQLPHEVRDEELVLVGRSTYLCRECYSRFRREPQREELERFL